MSKSRGEVLILSDWIQGQQGPQPPGRFLKIEKFLSLSGYRVRNYPLENSLALKGWLRHPRPDLVVFQHWDLESGEGQEDLFDLLREAGVPHLGSDAEVLKTCLSKSRTKKVLAGKGIPLLPWIPIRPDEKSLSLDFPLDFPNPPYFLKPDGMGNSRGLDRHSVVRTREDLKNLLEGNHLRGEWILEPFVGGDGPPREWTVAVVGNEPQRTLGFGQLVWDGEPGLPFVTTEDKNGNRVKVVAVQDPHRRSTLESLALKILQQIPVRDFARLDFLEKDGVVFFSEINGLPMVPDPWFDGCWGAALAPGEIFGWILKGVEKRLGLTP